MSWMPTDPTRGNRRLTPIVWISSRPYIPTSSPFMLRIFLDAPSLTDMTLIPDWIGVISFDEESSKQISIL